MVARASLEMWGGDGGRGWVGEGGTIWGGSVGAPMGRNGKTKIKRFFVFSWFFIWYFGGFNYSNTFWSHI